MEYLKQYFMEYQVTFLKPIVFCTSPGLRKEPGPIN